jgi:hypothetical protein
MNIVPTPVSDPFLCLLYILHEYHSTDCIIREKIPMVSAGKENGVVL